MLEPIKTNLIKKKRLFFHSYRTPTLLVCFVCYEPGGKCGIFFSFCRVTLWSLHTLSHPQPITPRVLS